MVECRIKGKFRTKGIQSTNPISVGDIVFFSMEEDGVGTISEIEERKNYIVRKSVNLSKRTHIIASNIDQVILVVTVAAPPTSTGFIDRFLVSANAYGIPVKIAFNKIDLYEEKEIRQLSYLKSIYSSIGYETFEVSAVTEEGLDNLKSLMEDKVTLFSGHSGVGKSTLANAIDENLDLRTGEISESHFKGTHTTTFAEMIELEFGGYVVDTPGIKGFGLVDIDLKELSHYFVEMNALRGDCKFHNCQHINEPKCAVIDAVENEEIYAERYKNYLAMYDSESNHYREDIYK